MRHIKIAGDQLIELEGSKGSSIKEMINDAIWFCVKNDQSECILTFNEFEFDICPSSNAEELIKEYKNSDAYKMNAAWTKE